VTDSTLIAKAKAGDRKAMGAVIAENETHLRCISNRYRGERDDLRQEARMAAIYAVKDYDPDGPYQFNTILGNRVRWWLRDGQRRRRIIPLSYEDDMEPACDASTLSDLIDSESRALFWACVPQLPDRERRVVLMRAEGMTFVEIGRLLGVTFQRAAQIEASAVESLRKLIRAGGIHA